MVMACTMILYYYLYQLHMNGRLLDVYHRLHGSEPRFIVPRDLEISVRELRRVLDDTKRWRGVGGGSRKIVVMNYSLPSPNNPNPNPHAPPSEDSDCITHVAIINVHINGTAELHRHFLRFPDGSFIEVFGNLSTMPHAQQQLLTAHLAANRMTVDDFLHVFKHENADEQTVRAFPSAAADPEVAAKALEYGGAAGVGVSDGSLDVVGDKAGLQKLLSLKEAV